MLKAKIWLALENGVWVARIQDPQPNRHRLPLKRCIFPITSNTSKRYQSCHTPHIRIVWNEKVRFGGYIQSARLCQWLWWIEILTNYLWPLLTPFFIVSQAPQTWLLVWGAPRQLQFHRYSQHHLYKLPSSNIGGHILCPYKYLASIISFPKLRILKNGIRGIKHGQTL